VGDAHFVLSDEQMDKVQPLMQIFNVEHKGIVELQHDGRLLMHCGKDHIWYLHVGDQEIRLDELMGNLELIKRVMNELADNAAMVNP